MNRPVPRPRRPRTPVEARALRAVGPALLLVTTLAACGGSADPGGAPAAIPPAADTTTTAPGEPGGPDAAGPVRYVALGDSYSAGAGIDPVDPGSGGCFRSTRNYPHQLAERLDLGLADATCSGATSEDLLAGAVAGDLPDLGPRTRLVTLSIGGNDGGLFTQLLGSCARYAATDPTGSPCEAAIRDRTTEVLDEIDDNVGAVIDAVIDRAPRARVVVVGYPALLPDSGPGCPDVLPVAAGDVAFIAGVNTDLSAALERAARAADVEFLDVATPSRGHDICAATPWVNGLDPAEGDGIPVHPRLVEQTAVADLLADLLADPPTDPPAAREGGRRGR